MKWEKFAFSLKYQAPIFRVLQKDESVISPAFSSSLRFSSLYLLCFDLINNWYSLSLWWNNLRMSMLVGSRCFAFASFRTACLFNLHSLSKHFLVTVLVILLLRLILPRLRDCKAALHRMFYNDWTASSTPVSELWKSQFMKSPINCVCCDINASVNKLSELGLVHTMPDKFENATLRAKTEQMFCVHTWKRNKCSASTLERFRWLFTVKIWQFEL